MLSFQNTSSGNKAKSVALMVIDPGDVDGAPGGVGVDNSHIAPQNTPIGTSINQGVDVASVALRDLILDTCHSSLEDRHEGGIMW